MVYGREYISLIGNFMKCFRCGKSSVLYQRYSGRHLCAEHLCADIESRAKRVIRQNQWLISGDRIGVVSGLPGSDALYVFLEHLVSRRTDISVVRVFLPQFEGAIGSLSWYQTLSQKMSESGVTRVALTDCAEDLAEHTLFQIISGDADALLSSDISCLALPYMQPFREIPAGELLVYTRYNNGAMTEDTNNIHSHMSNSAISSSIHILIRDFSSHHPSVSHALRRYRDNLREFANVE
ncbi:MAG: hypothetical protein CVV33_05630 [Methanomicrobiales archaeon HGW-Methanomicrobiales-4]|nr:MAG: hypothetical protein CVV33_05630 [Methanomicrobiales archaeon HGW-Methanomicrobiales-4]